MYLFCHQSAMKISYDDSSSSLQETLTDCTIYLTYLLLVIIYLIIVIFFTFKKALFSLDPNCQVGKQNLNFQFRTLVIFIFINANLITLSSIIPLFIRYFCYQKFQIVKLRYLVAVVFVFLKQL